MDRIIISLPNTRIMLRFFIIVVSIITSGTLWGQSFDPNDCPRGPVMRIPITSLTKSPQPGMMVLTDSCMNQYYVMPDSVYTAGDVVNQYFSGDTLVTILNNGDTLISISNSITGINYQSDTLCIYTAQGDTFCTIIAIEPDTSGTGRVRLQDNLGVEDTLWTNAPPAAPDIMGISNAVRLELPNTIKWGGDLVDPTTTVHSPDSTHNITYQDVNIMRHYGASMRFYPWDRFLIDAGPAAHISMTSRTSFYLRADTTFYVDLFQHGLTDTSYLQLRTDRIRKDIAKNGSVLQLLQKGSGTYQGNSDWTPYALPLSSPPDTGLYALKYQSDGSFDFEATGGGADIGPGAPYYLARWGPDSTSLNTSHVYDSLDVGIYTKSPAATLDVWTRSGAASSFIVRNVAGTKMVEVVVGNPAIYFGSASSQPHIAAGSGSGGIGTAGQALLYSSPNTSSSNVCHYFTAQNGLTSSGNHRMVQLNRGHTSGGSATWEKLTLTGTINSATTGAMWGLRTAHTVTAANDWRSIAIEEAIGKGIYQTSGAQFNMLAGNTHIGDTINAVRKLHVTGDLRVTADVDTLTPTKVWVGNTIGDLKRVNLGSDIIIQGDSIKVNVPALPAGTVLNSTLRWDGSSWVENDSLLVNENGESGYGGDGIETSYSITTPKNIKVNSAIIGILDSTTFVAGRGVYSGNNLNVVAVGYQAGQLSTAGGSTMVGSRALRRNSGVQNTAVGNFSAGFNLSSGNFNTTTGGFSGYTISTGSNNAAHGYEALMQTTSSGSNTAIGAYAMREATGAGVTFNTAAGTEALRNSLGITGTTAIGAGAGYNSTSNHSVFIGRNAGFFVTKDSTLIIETTSDTVATIVGDFEHKKVGINRNPHGIAQTLDVGGTARVRQDVTMTPTHVWAANSSGDFKKLIIGDGLGVVGDTLKVSYTPPNEEFPYIQAIVGDPYPDTVNHLASSPIRFDVTGWSSDWALNGDWIEYLGLDTFMCKVDCNITMKADAGGTCQITFHSDIWGELFGYEMDLAAGINTFHVGNHLLYPVPYANSVGSNEFSVQIKNTSGATRVYTIQNASITAIKVAKFTPAPPP